MPVLALGGANAGDFDTLHFFTEDADVAAAALDEAGARWRSSEVVRVTITNRAGALLDVARRLGASGINIESVFTLRTTPREMDVALRVDDVASARKVLEDRPRRTGGGPFAGTAQP